MEDLEKRRDEIQNELKQNQRPSVDVVHGYRKFSEDVNEFHDQVKDMKEMLVGASSDESRAKKQLTKLQLILNEVRTARRASCNRKSTASGAPARWR